MNSFAALAMSMDHFPVGLCYEYPNLLFSMSVAGCPGKSFRLLTGSSESFSYSFAALAMSMD